MPKYIECEALLKEVDDLKKSSWYNDDYGNGTRQARHDGVDCVVSLCIKQASACDVVEVVHGEWKFNKDGSGTCNQCGITQKNVWDYDGWQNYCGHCGADMRGTEKRSTDV